MRISRLVVRLQAYLEGLELIGARRHARVLRAIVRGLAPLANQTVKQVLRAALTIDAEGDQRHRDWLIVAETVRFLAVVEVNIPGHEFLTKIAEGSPMSIGEYLVGLARSLGQADSQEPRAGAARGSLVDDYVSRLEAAVHDPVAFPKVFEALKNDRSVGRPMMVDIASRFAFRMAKSTPKKVALERIWRMHSASEAFAAKSRAMKGKSAA